tara:strand:+ start:843 stop:1064 length:222 start_codon:yes stop_codon:yes gene_type:complete
MRKTRKLLKEECDNNNPYARFRSPIPPHLTSEERVIWEKEYKWEKQEIERRRKEGFYDISSAPEQYKESGDPE